MADQDITPDANGDAAARKRRIDWLTMLVGVASLAIAAAALIGGPGFALALDPRWLLAGGAVLVGVVLLVATVRPQRRRRDC